MFGRCIAACCAVAAASGMGMAKLCMRHNVMMHCAHGHVSCVCAMLVAVIVSDCPASCRANLVSKVCAV